MFDNAFSSSDCTARNNRYVRIRHDVGFGKVPMKRGVRRGDLLSELLFNLVMNEIIEKLRIKSDVEWGIRK